MDDVHMCVWIGHGSHVHESLLQGDTRSSKSELLPVKHWMQGWPKTSWTQWESFWFACRKFQTQTSTASFIKLRRKDLAGEILSARVDWSHIYLFYFIIILFISCNVGQCCNNIKQYLPTYRPTKCFQYLLRQAVFQDELSILSTFVVGQFWLQWLDFLRRDWILIVWAGRLFGR